MSLDPSMTSYYAKRANEYERIYHKPERQEDLRRLRGLVEDTFAGTHVLEVACGTGYWTEILARSAGSIVASDINEEVLSVARAKAIDPQRVEFRIENAYALRGWPKRFNAGFSGFWWSHIPRQRIREFLQGFHGALLPGATVMFIDNRYVEGSSTPISRNDEHGNSYQLRTLDDGSEHEVLKNFPSAAELQAALEGMGTNVRVELLRYYWILTYTVQPPLPAPPDDLRFEDVTLRFEKIVPGDPSRGLAPYYHFRILTPKGSDAGHINFKVGENRHIRLCAGHIGFRIEEAFRGRGYALQACRAIERFVRSVYDEVILTCDPDNLPSMKTIEKLGAEFVDEVDVPPNDPQYERGSRRKRRYRWTVSPPNVLIAP